MMALSALSNCPPGLQYLANLDQILVRQTAEMFETLTGFETSNKYYVLNAMGQQIFKAVEINNCCSLNCCGSYRGFKMKIFDNSGQEVIELERPLRCSANCIPFCCCGQSVKVYSPPGNFIGEVRQKVGFLICFGSRYVIEDDAGEERLRVNGPCCFCDSCCNVDFKVLPMDTDEQIGVVTKHWGGLVKEAFTDADNFGVSFPLDLEIRMKALLLAQTILIDFMYFENNKK